MTSAIGDVSGLPDRKVHDQEMREIGKITHIYAIGGDGEPAWVAVRASFGLFSKRSVIIPLSRLKEESGELVVPYSLEHIRATPEVDGDEIGEEDDASLREHFSIGVGDHELRTDNRGYVTLVPESKGTAQRAEDPDALETPDADKRDDETFERLKDAGPAETRKVDAGEIANELTTEQAGSGDGEERRERSGG